MEDEIPKRLRSLTGKNFSRVVTYVGKDAAFYHAVSVVPPGMKITIEPRTLAFTGQYQSRSFMVHVVVEKQAPPDFILGGGGGWWAMPVLPKLRGSGGGVVAVTVYKSGNSDSFIGREEMREELSGEDQYYSGGPIRH
ncbi:hypothetical protein RJ639_037750 [Escallonia herrerae]|uniref:Subtilisin-like protease fibronectin type-III domain-containing protein n=1 Tax=Escallonia herrerae TaxID=1293975 RepID=A0AA88WZF8_9ASTE|nr:hypothetical protein RJ639_037750 [Escallonia herrerae]